MIPVTKPFLPDKSEYIKYIDEVWKRNWLTNNGPILTKLESRLNKYLGLNRLLVVGNGTIALQIAIKALELEGEIITTPFSYVASTSSIVWENCAPVFADVNLQDFNIAPNQIEEKITSKTCGILATHVFGRPCEIDKIEEIGRRHNIKVIYDAAHAFGSSYKGRSIFDFGDVSTTSFHATKIFHTVEGGAIICKDEDTYKKVKYMRNFGHAGPEKFDGLGINGKNSELHSAMGLCNLNRIEELLERRKSQYQKYKKLLINTDLQFQHIAEPVDYNYSYFPVIFPSVQHLKLAESALQKLDIFPRRYFYPLLSNLEYVEPAKVPNAEYISERILCLPLYHDLKSEEIKLIAEIVMNSQAS